MSSPFRDQEQKAPESEPAPAFGNEPPSRVENALATAVMAGGAGALAFAAFGTATAGAVGVLAALIPTAALGYVAPSIKKRLFLRKVRADVREEEKLEARAKAQTAGLPAEGDADRS